MDALAFELHDEQIARHPPEHRDGGRLLQLPAEGPLRDGVIGDLREALGPGDLVVVNDTRVLPARVHARRSTGGRVEVLFLETDHIGAPVEAFLRPARRLAEGEWLEVEGSGGDLVGRLRLLSRGEDGVMRVAAVPSAHALMAAAGAMPLPPYLQRQAEAADAERYQTVYARHEGAVAAPTAGLHLTNELLDAWRGRGVGVESITLHVGPGTFRPLRPEDIEAGELHEEVFHIPEQTAEAVVRTRERGGRVLAVGTTSTRALESAALPDGSVAPGPGRTRLFIRPGYRFAVVDLLLTNFHLPRSSLLALVGTFAGQERVLAAYRHAVAVGYRFYSYGDAMLVERAQENP